MPPKLPASHSGCAFATLAQSRTVRFGQRRVALASVQFTNAQPNCRFDGSIAHGRFVQKTGLPANNRISQSILKLYQMYPIVVTVPGAGVSLMPRSTT